jgi:DNA repair protein RecN (Recombination protein N)
MLRSFYVKNYALIDEISIELEHGFTVITGETGAGKSILIDALELLLGGRTGSDVVRKGTEKAIIEGNFLIKGLSHISSIMQRNDIDTADEIIVRREISVKGQNRSFLNDTPVPLSVLKEIGDALVDLHGQHDHQLLLRAETHVGFLDDFAGITLLLRQYRISFEGLSQLVETKRELKEKEKQLMERRDLCEFQIHEIDEVNPQPGEEETLEAELNVLENAEKLSGLSSELYRMMYENDSSIRDTLGQARKQLELLAGIDPSFSNSVGEVQSAEIIIEELAKFLHSYNERIEFNPEKIEHLRDRIGHLALLKKKYGGSLDAVLQHRRKIGEEFALAENFGSELAKIEDAIEEQRTACSELARQLTSERRAAAKRMEKSVLSTLADLGIANAKFETRIHQRKAELSDPNASNRPWLKIGKDAFEATSTGVDDVEFFLSTNAGEEVKPLVKVASGGEVSRVMLALKSALAGSDKVPLLIFDEIDVGVSGRIGLAVGMSLKKLSKVHQVIAITHLPQIAGLADTHFAVEKTESNGRTSTQLRKLAVEERVHEVAKLMSGEKVTEAGLKSAKELLGIK